MTVIHGIRERGKHRVKDRMREKEERQLRNRDKCERERETDTERQVRERERKISVENYSNDNIGKKCKRVTKTKRTLITSLLNCLDCNATDSSHSIKEKRKKVF